MITGAVRVVDFAMLSADRHRALSRLCRAAQRLLTGNTSRRSSASPLRAVICFQAADIYQVQVFRGQLRQMTRMISSWAFVFLLFIGASFFAKLGERDLAALACRVLLRRPRRADCGAAGAALAGARAGPAKAGSTAAPSSSARTRTANS